jgi:hypothetical protein
MALIADLCPQCQRVTRCQVAERVSVIGGVLFGIPFVLPSSSVTCSCGECGSEFRSLTWDHLKAVSPSEAVSLDLEALLRLTNPALKERLALSELRANPRLREAFQLLDQLTPGGLRAELTDTLKRWERLADGQQERILGKVENCSEAVRFARSMVGRYSIGTAGCLVGALACVGVWSGCLVALGGGLNLWGWVAVAAAGLAAGSVVSRLLWGIRDRRWMKEVLVPEAQQAGIGLGWLLAVLEDGPPLQRVEDELRGLRELAPALRAQLAPSGVVGGEAEFGFGAAQEILLRPQASE